MVKDRLSFFACVIICIALLNYRITYSDKGSEYKELKVTTWDALGYYIYLPGAFIYHDVTELKWLAEIDKQYGVSGGDIYQVRQCKNGNYVSKYLAGVAIIEAPFFLIGHAIAAPLGYEADGFSPPYQYAVSFGILLWFLASLFLLRKILLHYFSDAVSAITLLLLVLATNIIEYAAIDNAQSHGPIFPLYVLVLYTTLKWHEKPRVIYAALTGFIIGLATISRPTEAIMIFIPLLWKTYDKESFKEKLQLLKQHKRHLLFFALFAFIAVLPQLVYWKIVTGSFVYDVGSKWNFLNPFFRVLFGWEKGWFIYTPVTVLFIIGMFYLRKFPFRKSVLWFCLLNIYIIISWHDWRYGGSYSTRALSQSYPVFALPLAAIIDRVTNSKWRWLFYLLVAYLVFVNLFQIKQYNKMILHNNDMNRKYYGRIYLNNNPTPLDMSLLDTDEFLSSEKGYNAQIIFHADTSIQVKALQEKQTAVVAIPLSVSNSSTAWLRVDAEIKTDHGFDGTYFCAQLQPSASIKQTQIRLFSPISEWNKSNEYAFYMRIPESYSNGEMQLFILPKKSDYSGVVTAIKVTKLERHPD